MTNTSPLLLALWPCLFLAAQVYVPESVAFCTGSIYNTPFKIFCRRSTGSSRLSVSEENHYYKKITTQSTTTDTGTYFCYLSPTLSVQ